MSLSRWRLQAMVSDTSDMGVQAFIDKCSF